MDNIGFIGAGNMASAIIAQILNSKTLPASKIAIYDISADKRGQFAAAGHTVCESVEQLVAECDVVVLATKPQSFPEIMSSVAAAMRPEKLLVSIAAGITARYIQQSVGFPCKLVMVMANTPLMVGAGATALSCIEPTSREEFEEIRTIFSLGGIAEEVPPDKINAAMSIHSTMPAFLYLYAKTVVECAQQYGIDPDTANRLFCQTLVGAAKMMTETGKSHQQLIDMVTSPGGTTLAGLAALDQAGFVPAIRAGFEAGTKRAEELAK